MIFNPQRYKLQEVISWLLLVFFILIPIWSVEWFHTGDGSAHLYCANVFNQLLFNDQSIFHRFFELNLRPVPNSIIQLLLSLLLNIFSPQLTMKIVTTLVIIIFCGGYLVLIRQLTGNKSLQPLLVFTIVFNYPLIMGFYSFIISLGMMMICIAFYFKNLNEWNIKKYMIFSVLLLITWFSHLFGFAATLLFIFINELVTILKNIQQTTFKFQIQRSGLLLLTTLPVVLLTAIFAQKASGATTMKFIDIDDLLERLNNVTALITYNNDIEKFNIAGIEITIVALIIAGIFYKSLQVDKKYFIAIVTMIFCCAVLYFILPYEFFAGGYINVRMMLLMILFIMIAVDCIELNRAFTLIKMVVIVLICASASFNQLNAAKAYDFELKELYSGITYIKDNSVVLPVGYTENWLQYNFPLYLSADKNIVVLDNNEALSPNSLVRWKSSDVFSNMGTCGRSNRPLFEVEKYEHGKSFAVQYIMRWHWNESFDDSSTVITNKEIEEYFKPVYRSAEKRMEVFERK